MWFKSFVLGELSFVTMPLSCNCMKMKEIQFWNCLPKLVHCTQWQPCGVVTQDGMTQNLGFLKMSNFDIYVVLLAFGAILWPKFGSFHVGSPHHLAVTGYNELTLVVNCMNELCSSSNNTVSKAFWRKKVLPEQRISYCAGIYSVLIFTHVNINGNIKFSLFSLNSFFLSTTCYSPAILSIIDKTYRFLTVLKSWYDTFVTLMDIFDVYR